MRPVHPSGTDSQVAELKRRFVYGWAGVCRLPTSTLNAVHAYAGAEVAFYFAWVATYTRALWAPAAIGVGIYLADSFYFESRLAGDAAANVTAADGNGSLAGGGSALWVGSGEQNDARFERAIVRGGFGLLVVVWASCFEEVWKRRSAIAATEWGELDGLAPPPPANPHFRSNKVKSGFYTASGLFVSLEGLERADKLEAGRTLRPAVPSTARDVAGKPLSPTRFPRDLYFSPNARLVREVTAVVALLLMGLFCLACIVMMQLFASHMEGRIVTVGGVDISPYAFPLANSVMILVFNTCWRQIALLLSYWENDRLEERYRAKLTYKLFVFQCINCYFSLFYIAFLKPFGIQLFGIELKKCHVRPSGTDDATGDLSCAEQLRALLLSILVLNIVVGQAIELSQPFTSALGRRIAAAVNSRREARQERPLASQRPRGTAPVRIDPAAEPAGASSGVGVERSLSLRSRTSELAAKKQRGLTLSAEEAAQYTDEKGMVDVIADYERVRTQASARDNDAGCTYVCACALRTWATRVCASLPMRPRPRAPPLCTQAPVKSISQGLSSTFYEYNELVIQYGYVVMFSIALPVAPLLALANNLVELRTDAFKILYAARRIRACAARNIGPWRHALKVISFAAISINLGYLWVTEDVFHELQWRLPTFATESHRIGAIVVAEHVLLALKVLIDFWVPDVPDFVKIRLARDEYVAEHSILQLAGAQQLRQTGQYVMWGNRVRRRQGPGLHSTLPTVPEIIKSAPSPLKQE